MVIGTFFTPFVSLLVTAGTLGAWWAVAKPRLTLWLLFFSLVVGQVVRIPLPGQGGGLLLSDIAVGLVLVAVAARYSFLTNRYALLATPFVIWSLFTIVIHIPDLGLPATLVAGSYWLRLTTHLLLLPALVVLFQDNSTRVFARRWFVISVSVLVLLGFVFLAVGLAPRSLGGGGWDPHQGRLVATWLDPNFIGALCAIAFAWIVLEIFDSRGRPKQQLYLLAGAAIVGGALAATQSRSSVIALLAAGSLLSPAIVFHVLVISRQRVATAVQVTSFALGLLALAAVSAFLLGSRFTHFLTDDPTVAVRAQALQAVWQTFAGKTVWVGEGYNAYQFAAVREGIINSFEVHSRAGADNSLLTLWVTTGLLGVVLFLLPWVAGALGGWHVAWRQSRALALMPLVALCVLIIHSQVVNSLLYGHLLIVLAVTYALAM